MTCIVIKPLDRKEVGLKQNLEERRMIWKLFKIWMVSHCVFAVSQE